MDYLAHVVIWMVPLWMSLGVHEWAHAWAAWRLGDDTARLQGRLSLNPFVHLDPVGTVVLPLLGIPFGWAKPVPVEPTRFRRDVRMGWGMLLTALAGPVSNVVVAAISIAILVGLHGVFDPVPRSLDGLLYLLRVLIPLNVLLAVFNLLPIPPLDGSRIVDGLVPLNWRPTWDQFQSLGPILLASVILLPLLTGRNPLGELMRSIDAAVVSLERGVAG